MVLAALFLILEATSSNVTFSAVADIRQIASQLSQVAGTLIAVTPNVRSQTLTVEVHNKQLPEVLNRIAYVSYCKCMASANGYILKPDTSAVAAADQNYQKFRQDLYRRADIRRYAKLLGAPFDIAAATRYKNAIKASSKDMSGVVLDQLAPYNEMPHAITRAFESLLHDIPADRWVRPGHDIVAFSDKPKPGEGLLEAESVKVALKRYARESALETSEAPTPVGRLVLLLRETERTDYADAQLWLLDDEGTPIADCVVPLARDLPRPMPPADILRQIPDAEAMPPSEVLPEYMSRKVNPDLHKRVLDPVRYDPQDGVQGETWRTFGHLAHRDLVLNLWDEWVGESQMVPTLKKAIISSWGTLMQVDSRWIVYRPRVLIADGPYQFDRASLRDAIAAVRRKDGSEMAAVAKFAYRSRYKSMPGQLFGYLELVGAGKVVMMMGSGLGNGWGNGFMAFFGSLSRAQQRRWLNGTTVPASELSPEAKTALTEWLESSQLETTDGRMSRVSVPVMPEAVPSGIAGAKLCKTNDGLRVQLAGGWMCRNAMSYFGQ